MPLTPTTWQVHRQLCTRGGVECAEARVFNQPHPDYDSKTAYMWTGLGARMLHMLPTMMEVRELTGSRVGYYMRRYNWDVTGRALADGCLRHGREVRNLVRIGRRRARTEGSTRTLRKRGRCPSFNGHSRLPRAQPHATKLGTCTVCSICCIDLRSRYIGMGAGDARQPHVPHCRCAAFGGWPVCVAATSDAPSLLQVGVHLTRQLPLAGP
jgi:hypothetical protein